MVTAWTVRGAAGIDLEGQGSIRKRLGTRELQLKKKEKRKFTKICRQRKEERGMPERKLNCGGR